MIRVTVSPNKATGRWHVVVDQPVNPHTEVYLTKFFAMRYAVAQSKRLYRVFDQTVSLMIRAKDGRWQEERTYGSDPAHRPG